MMETGLKHHIHIDHVDQEVHYRNIGIEDFKDVFQFAHKFYLQEEHLMQANGGEPVTKDSTWADYVEDMSFGLGVMAMCEEMVGFAIGASLDKEDGPDPIPLESKDAHKYMCHVSEALLGVEAAFPLAKKASQKEGCEVGLAICSSPVSVRLLQKFGFEIRQTVDIRQYSVMGHGQLFKDSKIDHVWIVAKVFD